MFGGSSDTSLEDDKTRYVGLVSVSGTVSSVYMPLPVGGTLKNLQVRLSGNPGSGKSYTFTVMNGSNATALTCTVAGSSATTCTGSGTVVLDAGDAISLRSQPNSKPSKRSVAWSLLIEP